MALDRPYYRISRPFTDGNYHRTGDEPYLRDAHYAKDTVHLIRAYQLLESDLMRLLTFIEPADANLLTYSHRLYELLLRACTEFEANARAILAANGYSKKGDWNITDYGKIDLACKLSAFEVEVPVWRGSHAGRQPFIAWKGNPLASLPWYQDYNRVKHARFTDFERATLANVLDAVAGVFIILFAQFNFVVVNPNGVISFYTTTASGALVHPNVFFQITLPIWDPEEMYDFEWKKLKSTSNPIATYRFIT